MGSLSIRRAGRGDVGTLVVLQRRASLAGLSHIFPPERYPFPTDAVRRRWAAVVEDPEVGTYIGSCGGAPGDDADRKPAGLVALRPGWLEALYVDPAHWGAGVATALHDHAVAALRRKGVSVAELWVLEHNVRARSFYERRGWRPNGKTRPVPFPPYPVDVGYTLSVPPGEPL